MSAGSVGALALAAAAAAVAGREWVRRAVEHSVAARLPPGHDGIVQGAGPLHLPGGRQGVLLLHGFGDTPQSLHGMAQSFNAGGWTVYAPLLEGHGRSLRALSAARADDWLRDARTALSALTRDCDQVGVVGQSMGGSLAAILAAGSDRVASLVLLAPYLRMAPLANHLASVHRIAALVAPYVRSRAESSIIDPAARHATLGAGITTPRLLHELRIVVDLAWAAAPRAVVPTLMLQSTRDPRIAARDAELAFDRLGGSPKELRWFTRSAHVLSVDVDRDHVIRDAVAWLEQYARTKAPAGRWTGTGET